MMNSNTESLSIQVNVIDATEEIFFAKDSDLIGFEQDIMRYLAEGRSSFTYIHRATTRMILDYLDAIRIWDSEGNRLTASALTDVAQIKQWAIYHALYLIFFNNNNASSDIFIDKAKQYKSLADASIPNSLRLNVTGGTEENQRRDVRSVRLVRR